MKKYLSCVLLCAAIFLISFGIHISNTVVICIGGALAGVYDAMVYYKKD